jgi:hypothetical protein
MRDRPNIIIDRVITQNVWVHAPLELARTVLFTLLFTNPSVVLLQEWPNSRNELLKEAGAFHRTPAVRRLARRLLRRPWRPVEGWVSVRPLLGPTGPVILQASRYEVRRVKAKTLTGRRRVNPTARHPRRWLPANRVTVVEAFDHWLGRRVVFIDYHLWSGVQKDGHYSTDPADAARVAGHKAQVAAVQRLITHYLERGFDVYAGGDSNFDGLRFDGVCSSWVGREKSSMGTHDHGRRKIDDVHGPGSADVVDVIWAKDRRIDHGGVATSRSRGRAA